MSKGQAGKGTQISIGGPASGPASYVLLGECDDIPDVIPEWMMVNTTALGAAMVDRKPVILAEKDCELELNRVSSDAGQQMCQAAYTGSPPAPYWFRLQLPINPRAGQATVGDVWVFTAYVMKCGPKGIRATDWVKSAIRLAIVGFPALIPGS